jgi:hypothetical protein
MEIVLAPKNRVALLLVDSAAFLMIYLIPIFAHHAPFPLYYAEPMRIVTLAVYFLSRNYPNALFLAFTIPLFSMFCTGHPVPLKALLISTELVLNIALLRLLMQRFRLHHFLATTCSILFAKSSYYILKYLLLSLTLLSGSLVSIPLPVQGFSVLITAAVFSFFLSK